MGVTPSSYTNSNNLTSDPDFVSSTDFHLNVGSPAIDAGVTVLDRTTDYEGSAMNGTPDIGAYEYDGTVNIPVTAVTVTGTGGATTIVTAGGTLQMLAHIDPHDATNQDVYWTVINGTGRATINSAGLLTAQADGTVTVKATSIG
jgi:uncharacterized protein YjdB